MKTVRDLMTKDLYTLRKTDRLNLAEPLMKAKRIRHVPIVDIHNRLVGLVTQRDILRAVNEQLKNALQTNAKIREHIAIADIMHDDCKTVEPDVDLKTAAKWLFEHKYGCLPVVENDKLVGIITEADFLKLTLHLMS